MKKSLFRNVPVACAPSGAAPLSCSNASLSTLHKVLGLAFAFLAQSSPAQTWQTVDDFQYVSGKTAENFGLCVAPNGMLFAAGWAIDNSGVSHALVMASSDGGNTWSAPLDDYVTVASATMGRDLLAMARCSRSTRTARLLRYCIASLAVMTVLAGEI